MLSTLLIALREGLEASLIVGILVAYLVKSDRRNLLPFLWSGVTAAIVFSLGLGAFLTFTSTQLSERGEEVFAGTTSLLAVGLVTWMVFWMRNNSRNLRGELHEQMDKALPMGKFALVFASFLAVAREGLETALFLYTNFKTVSTDTAPSIGLILGLAIAVVLGVLIYRRSVKLNLGKFFKVTGIALLIIAGGVFSHGLNEFQHFGALPGDNAYVWNFHNDTNPAITILDGTVGLGSSMTWLQLIFWTAYLTLTLRAYTAKPRVVAPVA